MKRKSTGPMASGNSLLAVQFFFVVMLAMLFAPSAQAVQCDRTITARVVVLDNPTVFNRLGAQNPNWTTFALRRDVVQAADSAAIAANPALAFTQGLPEAAGGVLAPGQVELRPDKRPRPLVVRSAAGDCLNVDFQNLLDPVANPNNAQQDQLFNDDQVADRCASFHAQGVELVGDMNSDGSWVGNNNPGLDPFAACGVGAQKAGLVGPGGRMTYRLFTPHEGTFTVNSYGATIGSEQSGGNLGMGMFAQLNVQPKGARFYRSQVTEEELRLATVGTVPNTCVGPSVPGNVHGVDCNLGGQPIIHYDAFYPFAEPWISEGKAFQPVLKMLNDGNELVHSDINAIIVGPNPDGSFPPDTYPLESVGKNNPALPNRLEPFREFSSIFHDEQANSQVFPRWYGDPVLHYTLAGVKDQFMINYGSGGIGSEIIANRLHTGPMHDCTDCAYEEFFLASQTVGDPGLLVDKPANTGIEQCDPAAIAGPTCWRDPVNLANGPIPDNFALYQEDPSNVHHAYTGDFVKIRNIHAGAFEQHIFHLHNHQWLFNPNDDNSNYLDAQEIMPGSGHTYELVNGGAGNRNKTAGDAIFHCHFYPHFAQGMWYHIRNLDMFERGTVLNVSGAADPHNPQIPPPFNFFSNPAEMHTEPFALRSGQPMPGARAHPDGELPDGVAIPAVVPIPGKPMPAMPARVSVAGVDRGSHSLLGGRAGPDGVPDSSQAFVDFTTVAGADGQLHTADDVSPGFPFWLAGNTCGAGADPVTGVCPEGIIGQRMPTPPLDMLTEQGATANGFPAATAGGWDGGLPRHAMLGYVSGGLSLDTNSRLDFRKIIELAKPVFFPEIGTDLERVSMAYQSVRTRPTAANQLNSFGFFTTPGEFVLNGAPPVPGGPYQDPCIDDVGQPFTGGPYSWFDGDGDSTTYSPGGAVIHGSGNPRTYKIANVQIDAIFNKVGYHYPQERIIALWEDVEPTILKQRPPEPLVMRFNSYDCGKILHTNLVPSEFELDDFQVRTPTDIIGQHIHLPKWDLTTGDGAANGWNYEDGTLSPQMVQERIHAINEFNVLAGSVVPAGTLPGQLAPIDLTDQAPVPTLTVADGADPGSAVVVANPNGTTHLDALPHPFFGAGVATQDHLGARTTIQRILVDPLFNVAGVDRGLGLTFSHDHYGPSTFQQIGLYSTILAEPAGSTWVHNETGTPLGTRLDGGPTTWQAVILTPEDSPVPAHREFYFEMSDFQHAYEADVYVGADQNGVPIPTVINQPDPFNATVADAPALNETWKQTVNPPLKLKSVPFPDVVTAEGVCPGPLADAAGNPIPGTITNASPFVLRPCAEAINISHSSMFVVNYRNEPVGLRVFDPNAVGPDGRNGSQAAGPGGDLAFAMQSRTDRALGELNTSLGNTPYPNATHCDDIAASDGINCDRLPGDPFTPIMRAYERDHVKVKIQVGATEEQHQTTIHGLKWLSNGSAFGKSGNSGWRNFQSHGISEQFSLQTPLNPDPGQAGNNVDYLYATDATRDGIWTGPWGLLRTYGTARNDLVQLPTNPQDGAAVIANEGEFNGVCPVSATLTEYQVVAVLANDVLSNDLNVVIPQLGDIDPLFQGLVDELGNPIPAPTFGEETVGGPLDPNGGTLVFNRRQTNVPDVVIAEPGLPAEVLRGGDGPLNDPTAMMYVLLADLVMDAQTPEEVAACDTFGITDFRCPARLRDGAPVEPLVLRANAGDCIQVTLFNRLPEVAPDLAGWQDMMWVVNRDINVPLAGRPPEMHFFNNNLIRPSSHVGMHAQLVEYDASRNDGILVGQNSEADAGPVAPGGSKTYTWYAGDLTEVPAGTGLNGERLFELVATPVEFGGVNLLSADRIKQPQKALFGALVIEPAGSLVTGGRLVADGQANEALTPNAVRETRAQVAVSAPVGDAGSGGNYSENLLINHKISNLRWADGTAIPNLHQGELGREGAEDSGHAGFNYGMEPSWFRFQLPPDVPFGNAGTPNSFGSLDNAHAMYSNNLVAGEPNAVPAIAGVSAAGDPATPVFRAPAGAARIHVLNGASADRDGTFMLHGHLWQRDPFVCTGAAQDASVPLPGRCDPNTLVPSLALGLNPQGKYLGAEEGMGHVYAHWPILFDAGGSDGILGDYLIRDYAPNGNRNGQFGILRVE